MNHSKQLRITAVMIGMMIIAFIPAFSQNGVGINPTGAAADPSAMLDVSSTTKGILVPRMTAAQRAALVLPATGLMVFQTDGSTGYYFNTGTPVTPGWILVNDAAALSGTVPVASGGTGAVNPNNARGNLGAAASGANSDITSLTGIVTPIAVDAGGSGTSFLTGYLKGNGGSPFTAVSSIPGSDVTGNISGNAVNFTGSLSGDISGTQTTTSVDMVGGVTSANVASGTNAANAATNANTASTIVKRDASGNFSAGTVTADLTGNVTGNVSGTAANVTGTVAVPNGGTGATTLTGYVIGNGTSAMTAVSSIPGSDITGNISGDADNVTGVVAAANGGTGNSSYTIGDIIYASGASTLSKLADVATGNALISGGAGTAPSYGKIGLATHVSGTLPVANGGTGATSLTGMLKGNGTSAVSVVTGTANFAARWSDANTISTGKIQDNNTSVGINVAPTATEMLTSAGGASLSGINGTTTSATSGRYGVHGNGVTGADGYLGYVLAAGTLGATTVTNPAVMGSVTAGSGPGLAGGTSGTATSAAIIGSSSVWNGGNFSSSLAGAICLVGSNTAAAGTGIGMGIFG
ncbi:MAG TPA: hypothetical protein VJY62_21940, partial [Bacteroidia bacterium]|nr:hypothetical protein [Bacteroidia bacterium]